MRLLEKKMPPATGSQAGPVPSVNRDADRARPNSARIVTARACVSGCCLLMSMRPEAIASFPIWASGLLLAGATAGAILIEPDHCVFRPLDWTSLIDGSHRVELDQYPPILQPTLA